MADAIHRRLYARCLRFEPLESRRLLSITVDTLVDENNGVGAGAGTSLREAIAAAVAGDTIDFSVTGTINLSVGATNGSKHLTINKSVTISGPGADLLTIKAFDPTPAQKNGDGSGVLRISDSALTVIDTTISGVTISGGDSPGAGAGIFTYENLTLENCVISGNTSTNGDGGGIYSFRNSLTIRGTTISGNTTNLTEGGGIRKREGTLVIENSAITNNIARRAGGGISAADHGIVVQIRNSTINQNQVTTGNLYGGGIFTFNSITSITASTISGNTAPNGAGLYARFPYSNPRYGVTVSDTVISGNSTVGIGTGGLGNGAGIGVVSAPLALIRCTISGNTSATANGTGGGVWAQFLTMVDSTVSGNSAKFGGGIMSFDNGTIVGSTISGNSATSGGGGIYNSRHTLTITSTTITANTSPAAAPGTTPGALVSKDGVGISTKLQNSIVAGNINGDVASTTAVPRFVSLGYNLIGTGNAVSAFNQTGDQTGVVNPMLGNLADNGGPTKTHVPLAGSPAIDAGDPAAVAGVNGVPLYDQRGKPHARVWDADGVGGGRIDIGAVELQTLPLPKAVYGDYNADGVVDGGDYVLSRKTVGANVTPYADADGSGNGVVGAEDNTIWRAHYGETYAAGIGSSVDVISEVQAGVSSKMVFESLTGGSRRTAGQASCGTRIWALAKPVAPQVSRDDALVAWVESSARVREIGPREFEPNSGDLNESTRDVSCDELDVAVGDLMHTAAL